MFAWTRTMQRPFDRFRKDPKARVAAALRRHRHTLVDALLRNDVLPNRFGETEERFRAQVDDGLELFICALEGREGYAALWAGQRVIDLYEPNLTREANTARTRESLTNERAGIAQALRAHLASADIATFEAAFDQLTRGLGSDAKKHVRTLFVGDCMMAEIASFLIPKCLADGISIDPFPVNSRDPATLKRIIEGLAPSFDVIFVSPFSHARLPELEALLDPRHALDKANTREPAIESILAQTQMLLDLLADRYECPIYVHNAALLQRGPNALKVAAKEAITLWPRALASARINGWVHDYVKAKNAASFRHLYVLDESELVRKHGRGLGAAFHDSDFQHAVRFSEKLAGEYHQRIATIGLLAEKKVVVCDLDNTLWEGVIGEGAVKHHEDRQRTLKKLRAQCGVVLSIASKNDPRNIHWDGAVLGADDFVSPQIHWGHKSQSIKRIHESLNLQTKHMVFVDDRPDERAMVSEAFPDVLVLDALDPETWMRMTHWSVLTEGASEVDRTKMYLEREQREAFVVQSGATDVEAADPEMLSRLGLTIHVRTAAKSDLKRVAELISRTNQWNLCGSRTSFQQVRDWHASPDASVLVADVSDRFGDMGTVCVAIVETSPKRAEIPVFVLSCRVFGYGVETAMLAHIAKRSGVGSAREELIGKYKATAQNHLAKGMYADHGFASSDADFVWRGAPAITAPSWAKIVAH